MQSDMVCRAVFATLAAIFSRQEKNDGKHLFSVIYPQHPTLAYICARSMYRPLYAPVPGKVPPTLQPLVGGKINVRLIRENWPDILRLAASMVAGTVVPSQILRKLAAYPRQNSLALALREVGRLERSIFMLDWLGDIDLQRRAQIGLNKGEAHHALKRAVNFNRRGEIRDRTSEGQQHRIASLNLLTAIIIYWNTWKLGEIVAEQIASEENIDTSLLPHVSPLGWEHITLTGEYRWPPLR